MNIKMWALLIFLGGVFCSQANATENKSFVLKVIHMNDTHSQLDPTPATIRNELFEGYGIKNGVVYTRFGGYPRLLTMAKTLQEIANKEKTASLTLHAGDAWQGSGYFKLYEGMANAELLNHFKMDAMALGNHEMDLDNEKLSRFIKAVNFPILAANVNTSKDLNFSGDKTIQPYTIISFNGSQKRVLAEGELPPKDAQTVAVVGLALENMRDIAPNSGEMEFQSEVKAAQSVIDSLKAKGINKIVFLTHIGVSRDMELASKVDGIDVIVGGHSHSLLGNFDNLGMGRSETPYAKVVYSANGIDKTCIVQAGAMAQAIGNLDVVFDESGRVAKCFGRNILLASEGLYSDVLRKKKLDDDTGEKILSFIKEQGDIALVQEDAELRGIIDVKYKPTLNKSFGAVIAAVPSDLPNTRYPAREGVDKDGSAVAPLVADAFLWWANTDKLKSLTKRSVDLSIVPAGGVRSSISAGDWREGDARMSLLPFKNTLSVVSVKGSDIRKLLTDTLDATLPKGAHTGKFPYGGNLRYTFKEVEPNKKGLLTAVEVKEEDGSWGSLDDNKTYNVILDSYSADGNDGWGAILSAQQVEQTNRVDVASINGDVKAFNVSAIKVLNGNVTKTYQGERLNCDTYEVDCGVDAIAFTEWAKAQRVLIRKKHAQVKLERKENVVVPD
jgi:5'-nucleotidase